MLDSILNLIKTTVSKEITGDMVPQDKQAQTVETTTQALADGLRQHLNGGNIGHLLDLLKGEKTPADNPVVGNLQSNVVSSLMQKVGLPQNVAGRIATAVIPAVMKMFSGKAKEMEGQGVDVKSLIHSFSSTDGSKTNLLESVGKMFGR